MTPLQSRALKAFANAVERIHQETDLDRFPARVLEVIEELMPGVLIVSQEFNTRTKKARSLSNRPTPPGLIERCGEIIPMEHPIFHAILKGAQGAMRLSDFWTVRELEETRMYDEIFQPLGVRHEIVLPLVLPNHVAGLTISRDRAFTDDEVTLAQLMAPQIALAHVHAQRFSALKELERNPEPSLEAMRALGLTPRESEVLHWIIEGKRDIEISQIIGGSSRTIQKHVENIIKKLRVETRTGAAVEAIRRCAQRAAQQAGGRL